MMYEKFFEGSFDSQNIYKEFSKDADSFTKLVKEVAEFLPREEFISFLNSLPTKKRQDFNDRLALFLGAADKLSKVARKHKF